jgi:hypothetical protein
MTELQALAICIKNKNVSKISVFQSSVFSLPIHNQISRETVRMVVIRIWLFKIREREAEDILIRPCFCVREEELSKHLDMNIFLNLNRGYPFVLFKLSTKY